MVEILTWPAFLVPQRMSWLLVANTQQHSSPFTRDEQTLAMPGERWRGDISLPPLEAADARRAASFLARLRGTAGRFYRGPPDTFRIPRGAGANDSPKVDGGDQSGVTLATKEWTPNATVLLQGDFFSVDTWAGGRELKCVREDVVSDGSGNAVITFDPPIRRAPVNSQLITLIDPTCIMRLLDDTQGEMMLEEADFATGLTMTVIESYY